MESFKNLAKSEPEPKVEEKKLVSLPTTLQESEQFEPLLAENKQRFVLFPIKYHEVMASRTDHTSNTC